MASRVLDNGLSQEQVSRADYERWELARAAGVTTPADYEVFQALMRRRLAGEATRDDFINSGLNYPAFEHALDLQSDSWPSPGRNYNLRTSRKASHLADIPPGLTEENRALLRTSLSDLLIPAAGDVLNGGLFGGTAGDMIREEAGRVYAQLGLPPESFNEAVATAVGEGLRFEREYDGEPWKQSRRVPDFAAGKTQGLRMAGSPWFQEQLGLLALPTRKITDAQTDGMDPIYDRLQAQAADPRAREAKRAIGDIGDGDNRLTMVMEGRRVGMEDVYVPHIVVSDRVDQLIDRPPAGMGEISFGWEAPDGRMFYGELSQGMRPPMGAVATDLKKALPELLDEMGLQEGDLVRNQPLGVGQGDYRRAMTYARQGFGPVDNEGLGQLARINSSGGLSPELLVPAHQGYSGHFRRRVGRRAGG